MDQSVQEKLLAKYAGRKLDKRGWAAEAVKAAKPASKLLMNLGIPLGVGGATALTAHQQGMDWLPASLAGVGTGAFAYPGSWTRLARNVKAIPAYNAAQIAAGNTLSTKDPMGYMGKELAKMVGLKAAPLATYGVAKGVTEGMQNLNDTASSWAKSSKNVENITGEFDKAFQGSGKDMRTALSALNASASGMAVGMGALPTFLQDVGGAMRTTSNTLSDLTGTLRDALKNGIQLPTVQNPFVDAQSGQLSQAGKYGLAGAGGISALYLLSKLLHGGKKKQQPAQPY